MFKNLLVSNYVYTYSLSNLLQCFKLDMFTHGRENKEQKKGEIKRNIAAIILHLAINNNQETNFVYHIIYDGKDRFNLNFNLFRFIREYWHIHVASTNIKLR